jgi:hypothetical protein
LPEASAGPIERLRLPDPNALEQPVIGVEVGRSLFVHRSPGGYLHRVGSSKRPMSAKIKRPARQRRNPAPILQANKTRQGYAPPSILKPAGYFFEDGLRSRSGKRLAVQTAKSPSSANTAPD